MLKYMQALTEEPIPTNSTHFTRFRNWKFREDKNYLGRRFYNYRPSLYASC